MVRQCKNHKRYLSLISSSLTQTSSTASSASYSSKLFTMTSSKKKKSSAGLRISRPQVSRVRTVRVHQNDSSRSRTGASTSYISTPATSLEQSTGMSLATQLESTDNLLAEQMNQSDMLAEHYDSMDEDFEATKGYKPRTRTKVMDDWLTQREGYLYEMLRHDGREGLQATPCTSCGGDGSFSCSDCAYCMYYCRQCLVNCHHLMPFHRIKVP